MARQINALQPSVLRPVICVVSTPKQQIAGLLSSTPLSTSESVRFQLLLLYILNFRHPIHTLEFPLQSAQLRTDRIRSGNVLFRNISETLKRLGHFGHPGYTIPLPLLRGDSVWESSRRRFLQTLHPYLCLVHNPSKRCHALIISRCAMPCSAHHLIDRALI